MKNLIIALYTGVACVVLCNCSQPIEPKEYNRGINIIPAPANLTEKEGSFTLSKSITFYAPTGEAQSIAHFFTAKLLASTGYKQTVTDQKGNEDISLLLEDGLDINAEGYLLDITPKGVMVKAKTAAGLFYGMESFMQMLPAEVESPTIVKDIAWTVPAVSIKDEPRFGYRGLMLDPCRHFIPVENMKKHIDVMALFKLNRLHWHLTDDQGWRIEIKKYPKLTEVGSKRVEGEGFEYGGFYTQEEIKEIVQYAADRFITIIPEVELPGHGMAAIAAYPELSCTGEPATPRIIWGVEDIVFCAGKEEPFQFLEDVIAEIVPLFPGEYFHVGGDECPKTSWEKCPLCQKRIREENLKAQDGHSAEERLQSYFVQRMEKVVSKYGKKMIGWDEILEGGLAPSATVMSWRGEEGGIAAAAMDHNVIMSPNPVGLYIDQFEGDSKIEPVSIGGYTSVERIYQYDPVPDTLKVAGKGHYILGAQANAWSEYMYQPELVEYRIYPRILSLAEITWTPLNKKDYTDFERRLNNALVRLDGHNINYHIPMPEQPNGSCNHIAFTDKATLEFTTKRPMKMVYTVDGQEPVASSAIYETAIEFTESGILKIRSVLPSGKMSKVRDITIEKQALAPAKIVEKTTSGLKLEVAYGYFLDSSQLANVRERKSSVISSLSEITQIEKTDESMRGVKQYGAVATGYVSIPENGVYFVSSDNEEVWIDGKLMVSNQGEVKRFSRHDSSVALAKGLHEIKVVFLGHIIGGWPSNWNDGHVALRKSDAPKFSPISPEMLTN